MSVPDGATRLSSSHLLPSMVASQGSERGVAELCERFGIDRGLAEVCQRCGTYTISLECRKSVTGASM